MESAIEKLKDGKVIYLTPKEKEWLIKQVEKVEELTKANKELNNEIGAYAGTVEALTEEFGMLTGRMKVLKSKMLNKN
jgi:hypothetical protein